MELDDDEMTRPDRVVASSLTTLTGSRPTRAAILRLPLDDESAPARPTRNHLSSSLPALLGPLGSPESAGSSSSPMRLAASHLVERRPGGSAPLACSPTWGGDSLSGTDGDDGDGQGSRFWAVKHSPKGEAPFSAPQAKKILGPKSRYTVILSAF